MTGEDPADELLHAVLFGQEPAGGVGDGHRVVPDLERGDGPDVEADALIGDAVFDDFRFAQRQRQEAGLLLDGHDKAAVPGDDAELSFLPPVFRAGDEQGLVRRWNMPEQHGGLLGLLGDT